MKRLLLTAVAGLVALSAQGAAAQSQLTNPGPALPGVCVYHNERLLAQSSAGQSLNQGMQRLVQEVQGELEPYGTSIQSEATAIQQLPEDQRAARVQALQQRIQEAQQLEQTRDVELRYTRAQQINAIATAVDPIIVAVYQERGCGLLLDRESVYVLNPAMDITDTVIERLNSALPSLSFTRQSPPVQQQQQQKAAGGGRPGMPDPRFFASADPLSVAELGALTGARVSRGGDLTIASVAPLSLADRGAVAFLGDRRHVEALGSTGAGAVFVTEAMSERAPPGAAVLVTAFPQAAWAQAAARLHPVIEADDTPGIHPDAELEQGVRVAAGAVVGAGARIGRGTVIGANAVIGPGVAIGRDSRIGAGAVITFSLIGDRVRIASGAVGGEAGFGAAPSARGPVDMPQLGRVIIQDDVSIGANTCIDRGAFGDTVIGEGTKIDNLVQIAHNVVLGRFCLIAAHVGISGSVQVGDGVMFGGRAGVGDHQTVGTGARIAAAAAVLSDVPAGETWSGYPAKPLRRFLRETAWLSKQASSRRKGDGDE